MTSQDQLQNTKELESLSWIGVYQPLLGNRPLSRHPHPTAIQPIQPTSPDQTKTHQILRKLPNKSKKHHKKHIKNPSKNSPPPNLTNLTNPPTIQDTKLFSLSLPGSDPAAACRRFSLARCAAAVAAEAAKSIAMAVEEEPLGGVGGVKDLMFFFWLLLLL